ncbi:uncharacterized protein [Rhodnius prolixus]|uniref:uncharacterized protein n=1 Tax=Rhodnius prolixus TaxID=13249 RepID=UPI003D18A036
MSSSTGKASFLRRINALRRLQMETAEVDEKFSLQVLKLEANYDHKLGPFLERRRQIITGEYEPREEECDTALTYVHIPPRQDLEGIDIENLKGIPGFWFTVLNNIPIFWSMIQRHDCEPLSFLSDISCNKTVKPKAGFTLKFHFQPNQFFKNDILTKQYVIDFGKKNNDPFNMYGPEMIACTGCDINWTTRDLTVTIRKKKIIKRASFFNFFDPPKNTDDSKLQPYVLNYLLTDFQLGYYLKERIIPKAVLYYLGEAVLRENFGFADYIQRDVENEINIEEDWPTSYDRKSLLHKQYELDQNIWEKSEQVLSEKLSKRNFPKAENFEESKVNLNNLFLDEKPDESKVIKPKMTEKQLDLSHGKNNASGREEVKHKEVRKKATKTGQRISDQKKIPLASGNTSNAKRKGITKKKKETADTNFGASGLSKDEGKKVMSLKNKSKKKGKPPKVDRTAMGLALDESEEFKEIQKDLLSYYNERNRTSKEEPRTRQDVRTVEKTDSRMNLETLLASYYNDRPKKKSNKKSKP